MTRAGRGAALLAGGEAASPLAAAEIGYPVVLKTGQPQIAAAAGSPQPEH